MQIAPTEDMVSVDTLSLPGASIIIYNNWPRVPTGTPAFITRYCQVRASHLFICSYAIMEGWLLHVFGCESFVE